MKILRTYQGGMTIEEYCDKMGYYDMRPKEHAKGDIRMYRQAYPEATLHMSDGQVLDAIYTRHGTRRGNRFEKEGCRTGL
jgi:hypothetical protein